MINTDCVKIFEEEYQVSHQQVMDRVMTLVWYQIRHEVEDQVWGEVRWQVFYD